MQHVDQHREAILPTVRAKKEVSASIFSDKVKDDGRVAGYYKKEVDHDGAMVHYEIDAMETDAT